MRVFLSIRFTITLQRITFVLLVLGFNTRS